MATSKIMKQVAAAMKEQEKVLAKRPKSAPGKPINVKKMKSNMTKSTKALTQLLAEVDG